jgi:hypothetical protein
MKCCYQLERALAPTIIAKDKKAIGVYDEFEARRKDYRKANIEIGIRSDDFIE